MDPKELNPDDSGKIRKECTKENPFVPPRKENEIWTHVDAIELDAVYEGRFFGCPHCGTMIDLGPDI